MTEIIYRNVNGTVKSAAVVLLHNKSHNKRAESCLKGYPFFQPKNFDEFNALLRSFGHRLDLLVISTHGWYYPDHVGALKSKGAIDELASNAKTVFALMCHQRLERAEKWQKVSRANHVIHASGEPDLFVSLRGVERVLNKPEIWGTGAPEKESFLQTTRKAPVFQAQGWGLLSR